jgi:hypothetical protein
MFTPHRLIAAAAVGGALAIAGPVTGASAAQTGAVTTPATSSVPCYPFPAWCGSDGQPVAWAPWWVRPALGLPPSTPWATITIPQFGITPITALP